MNAAIGRGHASTRAINRLVSVKSHVAGSASVHGDMGTGQFGRRGPLEKSSGGQDPSKYDAASQSTLRGCSRVVQFTCVDGSEAQ